MNKAEKIIHPLAPIYNNESRVLILGTMPSPKSREIGFYYGHPQNRFWRVLAAVWQEAVPQTNDERRDFVLRHRIALWDVLASCTIVGAADASIKDAVANDLSQILTDTRIHTIATTGKTAGAFYQKYQQPKTKIEPLILPSTSPANCRVPFEALTEAYRVVREICDKGE